MTNFAERLGITREELIAELNRRSYVLRWMRQQKIRSYKEVASIIAEYYARRQKNSTKKLFQKRR